VPWAGRSFEANPFANDSGEASEPLLNAIRSFRSGQSDVQPVIAAFRGARLLIPLLADLGEGAEGANGLKTDKSADLSIVKVSGPDGFDVLPVFSSVQAMASWNSEARPVPSDATRVALAAASENTTRVVLDPGSDSEFAFRRNLLEAIAKQEAWQEVHKDAAVLRAFQEALGSVAEVVDFTLEPGDPGFLLRGAELLLSIRLVGGLNADQLELVMKQIGEAIAASEVVAERVDSLRVKLS
jgi:hypothetical protein